MVQSLPIKYAAALPGLFALVLSAAVLVGGEPTSVGSGGAAFFSFFTVPFLMLGALFVRQQKTLDQLREKLESKAGSQPSEGAA